MNYSTTSISVNADNVAHHCIHDDGTSSYRVHALVSDHLVYLDGTPAEILRFCDALALEATKVATR